MFQNYFSSRRSILFVLAGIIILALFAMVWRVVSLQRAASEAIPESVIKIRYCGVVPEELCVLSFGRNIEEKMVVNLFVPDRDFPDFYLKIQRRIGENIYECEHDREVPTSAYCYGDLINLQEKMKLTLFSVDEEHLLAAGDFTLNAVLISTQIQGTGVMMESISYPNPLLYP